MGITSGGVQKAKVMKEASDYCNSIGKQMLPISTNQNDVAWGKTPAAEVQFRCLNENDLELRRPTLEPVPEYGSNRNERVKAEIQARAAKRGLRADPMPPWD
jgi:hypothetical protein